MAKKGRMSYAQGYVAIQDAVDKMEGSGVSQVDVAVSILGPFYNYVCNRTGATRRTFECIECIEKAHKAVLSVLLGQKLANREIKSLYHTPTGEKVPKVRISPKEMGTMRIPTITYRVVPNITRVWRGCELGAGCHVLHLNGGPDMTRPLMRSCIVSITLLLWTFSLSFHKEWAWHASWSDLDSPF